MVSITDKLKHPLPLYSHLYSSSEDGFISANEETYKGLRHVRNVLAEKKATFVMDREYDNVAVMKKILKQEDHFIIRLKRKRNLHYQNKKLSVRDLALRREGEINFRTKCNRQVKLNTFRSLILYSFIVKY